MLTRRRFLARAGAAGAALVLAPPAALEASAQGRRLFRGGTFAQGVLSGDPGPDGITLLTLLDHVEGPGSVRLEVARDADFRRVVARRALATSGARNHAVEARLMGLAPNERYFYRFETRDAASGVGRFQTALPPDSREPVSFAFFSCADYTHGYYNAYDRLAREDVDFVVNLGDYVYAESYHTLREETGVREDRIGRTPQGQVSFEREAVTLADYRAKYRLYRSDRALRRVQERFPMVSTWDDHEVQNNYAGAAPGGGLEAARRFSERRRAAGYRAFFESMPVFPAAGARLYRALPFGRTVDLIMLDERRYRADQPCGDAVVRPCPDYDQPRDFLGRPQMDFLKQRLESSAAAWKVIGNEVMAMPIRGPGGVLAGFDSWQGYPREREELLEHVRARGVADVVFVTGDIHTFIAGDVRTQLGAGESVALEFVGGSITSQGLGEQGVDLGGGQRLHGNDRDPRTPPFVVDALRNLNPWVDQSDLDHHGYGVVRATQSELDVTLRRMATIKRRSRETLSEEGFRWRVARGQRSIKGVNGPPAT